MVDLTIEELRLSCGVSALSKKGVFPRKLERTLEIPGLCHTRVYVLVLFQAMFDAYMTQMLQSYNSRNLLFLKLLLEINLINKCSSGYIQNPSKRLQTVFSHT